MSREPKRGGRLAIVPGRALRDTAMTPKLREVLLAMAYYANRDGWCVVRHSTLADLLGATDTGNLRKYLRQLEQLGYLARRQRTGADGRSLASGYQVVYDGDLPEDRDRSGGRDVHYVDPDEVDPEEVSADGPGATQGGGYSGPTLVGGEYPAPVGGEDPPLMSKDTRANTTLSTPAPAGAGTPGQDQLVAVPASRKTKPARTTADVDRVYAAWCEARRETWGDGTRTRKLTAERRTAVRKALAEFPVEEVEAAARGWRHFPHNLGQNERGTVYDDLTVAVALRNVERFRDAELEPDKRPKAPEREQRQQARVARAMGDAPGLLGLPPAPPPPAALGAAGAA